MYAFNTELNLPMEDVISRLSNALSEQGLGIVSDINIQGIIQSNLEETFQPYRILGVCAPGLAKSLIRVDPTIGALLPCNIVVQELLGRTQVSFMDPVIVLGLSDQHGVNDIARQVRESLEQVWAQLNALVV
jgi:uncharacterized protein (DUF302 family)